jgi:hypothetical protein
MEGNFEDKQKDLNALYWKKPGAESRGTPPTPAQNFVTSAAGPLIIDVPVSRAARADAPLVMATELPCTWTAIIEFHQYVKFHTTFKLDHSHVKFSIQPDGLAASG